MSDRDSGQPDGGLAFRDPELDETARIDDLLSRLRLEEKIACLGTNPSIERLGIVASGHVEGLHGLAQGGPASWGRDHETPTTTFPQQIGLGETWDLELVRRAAELESLECRYVFHTSGGKRAGLLVRAPNADLGRDPRWGRTEECFGEDPYLCGEMTAAFVRGLQGEHPRYLRAASLMKHFLANSNEDERVRSSSSFDERLFREYYSVPFRRGVEAGSRAFMAAYNSYNGVPCTVHPMLERVARREWGQDGIICTDGGAFKLLVSHHRYFPDLEHAAAACLESGINQFLDRFSESVQGALDRGLLEEADLDAAIRPTFRVMSRLGLLDPPERVPYTNVGATPPWETAEARELCRIVTEQSVVLLENRNGTLPLDRAKLSRVAVVGPLADEVLLDWYSGTPPYAISPFAGMRGALGDGVSVEKAALGPRAIALAKQCDAVIVCVGNHPTCGTKFGVPSHPSFGKEAVDRKTLELPDEEDVLELLDANPCCVVVLISSFPFAVGALSSRAPALVHVTHNSQELGPALARCLLGDVNPGGRLVQTWPRALADLPPMMDYDLRHGRTYLYFEGEPLYPFGYGLSYTTFGYASLRTSSDALSEDEALSVRFELTNSGRRAGDEVVQLYVRHLASRVKRPLHELKGFRRVRLEPGETRTVELELHARDLAYWETSSSRFVVEEGSVELQIGRSSRHIELTKTIVVRNPTAAAG
jgi:beta-glucosidase